MSTEVFYSVLGCFTIMVVILIAIYNLIKREDFEDEKDLLAVVLTDNGSSDLNWKDFQALHVITTLEFPSHHKWCSKCWQDYMGRANISLVDNQVHTIISVEDDGSILLDFNPLLDINRESELTRFQITSQRDSQVWFRSQNRRTLYHLVTSAKEPEACEVYIQQAHYVAAVESVDLCPFSISDSRLAGPANRPVWVPLCLRNTTKKELKGLRKIK